MSDYLELIKELRGLSDKLDLEDFTEFDPSLLIPEERIREYCYQNICGNYEKHYMCPPYIGTIDEIKKQLNHFDKAILLRYSAKYKKDEYRKIIFKSKMDFHMKVLKLEKLFHKMDIDSWGLIGGSCSLCIECKATANKPCKHPKKARPSFESLGIDVQKLLDNFGLDNKFYPEKIVWAGCVLFRLNKDIFK